MIEPIENKGTIFSNQEMNYIIQHIKHPTATQLELSERCGMNQGNTSKLHSKILKKIQLLRVTVEFLKDNGIIKGEIELLKKELYNKKLE